MTNNKKQIEEMSKDLKENLRLCAGVKLLDHNVETIAYELSKKYQPKLPKHSVVLLKEEYESLKNEPVSIFKNYQEMVKFYGGEIRNLKAENEKLKNQLTKECKEMAEKFESELKAFIKVWKMAEDDAMSIPFYRALFEKIGELAKTIRC